MGERHILTEEDKQVLKEIKTQLAIGISHLEARGVRGANIEIELVHYIKKLLKKD